MCIRDRYQYEIHMSEINFKQFFIGYTILCWEEMHLSKLYWMHISNNKEGIPWQQYTPREAEPNWQKQWNMCNREFLFVINQKYWSLKALRNYVLYTQYTQKLQIDICNLKTNRICMDKERIRRKLSYCNNIGSWQISQMPIKV